jgi:hypothetical protein
MSRRSLLLFQELVGNWSDESEAIDALVVVDSFAFLMLVVSFGCLMTTSLFRSTEHCQQQSKSMERSHCGCPHDLDGGGEGGRGGGREGCADADGKEIATFNHVSS